MSELDSRCIYRWRWRLIEDGRFVRLIYVDEAGTSPAEPVRVVASVILHGDDQLRQVSDALEKVFDAHVPAKIRQGFIFHGLEVFNGGKRINRQEWPFQERLEFFKEVVNLPFCYGVPIALGISFAGIYSNVPEVQKLLSAQKITMAEFEHAMAFSKCIEKSDSFLRKYLDGKEIGTVVAENINKNKDFISALGMFHKSNPISMPEEYQIQERWQVDLGIRPQPYVYEIRNIVDVPHFVGKKGAPMLQLADACAFSFRRFLSKQSEGADLCRVMLGPYFGENFVNDPAWFSGGSSGLFNTEKYWSDDQRRAMFEGNHQLALKRLLDSISNPDSENG